MKLVQSKPIVKITEEELKTIREFCDIMLKIYDEEKAWASLEEAMEDIAGGRIELVELIFKIV